MGKLTSVVERCLDCGAELAAGQVGKCEACIRLECGDMTGVSPESLIADGITDYCEQVCGSGCCGSGPVCQFGIDHRTNMPATAEVLALVRRAA